MTAIGTWQTNRKGFPAVMKDFSHRDAPSTEIYYQKDGPLRIVSFVASGKMKTSKKSGKEKASKSKLITMLSTMEPFPGKSSFYTEFHPGVARSGGLGYDLYV